MYNVFLFFVVVILHLRCSLRCCIFCVMCYCIVLYCTVLYCIVFYCPVLHFSALPPGIDQFAVNNNSNNNGNNNNNNTQFSPYLIHSIFVIK